MLSYSTREIRRMGDQSTVVVPAVHVSLKSETPRAFGGAVEDPPPPSPPEAAPSELASVLASVLASGLVMPAEAHP
jgi:hypothetical protein